jgi:hypothetical protein
MSDDRDGGDFAAKYPMRDDDPATVRHGHSGPVSRETFEDAGLGPIAADATTADLDRPAPGPPWCRELPVKPGEIGAKPARASIWAQPPTWGPTRSRMLEWVLVSASRRRP